MSDRLLSDEELVRDIDRICGFDELEPEYAESANRTRQLILNLINTQKRLYAEGVIGEDEPETENGLLPDRVDRRNQLRAEQRARIK